MSNNDKPLLPVADFNSLIIIFLQFKLKKIKNTVGVIKIPTVLLTNKTQIMRATYFFGAILALALIATSCKKAIKPDSEITTETRQLSGFTKLDVSDAIEVEVSFTGQEEVIVEANANLHEYILTDVVNGTLKIRLKNNIRFKSGSTIKVYVSALMLEAAILDDASRLELTSDANAVNFDLDLKGASKFQGGIVADFLHIHAKGASRLEIWGTAAEAEMEISGASNVEDYAMLITSFLELDLSGASKAELTVDGMMNIEASGASRFNWKGNGAINEIDLSGSSTVNKQ